jgi:twitching motility protein PilT
MSGHGHSSTPSEPKAPSAPVTPSAASLLPPGKEPEANKLFRLSMKMQASDLHLKVGQPPMMRLKGEIAKMDMRPLTQEDMERLILPLLNSKQRFILDEEGGVDYSYVVGQDETKKILAVAVYNHYKRVMQEKSTASYMWITIQVINSSSIKK